MSRFRTIIPPYSAPFRLTHADRLLLAGSCFTEHIGARLRASKFPILLNPNGIVYNPVSIARMLEDLLREAFVAAPESRGAGESLPDNDLFEHQGQWHSWEHHGVFSHPDRETALAGIAAARREAAGFLRNTTHVLLTLGTAQVFVLRKTGRIVANNHKAPAGWFDQRRLEVGETVDVLGRVLESLQVQLPGLRVLLTVSPVRHLRNGFVENQRSKSVLLLACAELSEQFGFVHYFPAYELLLDDLRDYRFYTADMLHPNETAVDYVWDYFVRAFFPPETQKLLTQIDRIAAAARHRPFHPGSPEHRIFAQNQLADIRQLQDIHPGLDFSGEIAWFKQFCP